jgi:hypothetical protein
MFQAEYRHPHTEHLARAEMTMKPDRLVEELLQGKIIL